MLVLGYPWMSRVLELSYTVTVRCHLFVSVTWGWLESSKWAFRSGLKRCNDLVSLCQVSFNPRVTFTDAPPFFTPSISCFWLLCTLSAYLDWYQCRRCPNLAIPSKGLGVLMVWLLGNFLSDRWKRFGSWHFVLLIVIEILFCESCWYEAGFRSALMKWRSQPRLRAQVVLLSGCFLIGLFIPC